MANINKILLSGTTYNIQDENAAKTVELTQAQYDALVDKDPNTFYIITDATGGDLSNYYTKSETDDLLDTKLDVSAYTPTDLSNYYTKSETSGATEISTALASKADTATTYTKTGVDNAITAATSTKQDTLVSGTNIKTINNESILGSGNINIQGGGGGSSYSAGTGIDITNDVISVTGKVDTSTYETYTAATATEIGNKLATSDFNTYSGTVDTAINSKASQSDLSTLSGTVTAHTANTDIHVTTAQTAAWNAKSDFSGSYNDLTDKPIIPTVPTSNTAFTNDAGYITSDAISGKADTSAVTESINAAVSGKVDTSTFNTYSGSVETALSGKQDTLSAGTNITIVDNVISAEGGGGKTISAGTNISVTTGETADTINCTLPITASTSIRRKDITIGNDIVNGANEYCRITIGNGNKYQYGNSRTSNSILIATPSNLSSAYNVVKATYCIGIGGNGIEVGYDNINGYGSIAIGYGAKSIINKSLAIGYNTVASGTTQTNINNQLRIDTDNQIYIKDKTNTNEICLQDYLGGGGGTVDQTIISGSTNAVAGGAVYTAMGGLKLQQVTQAAYDALVSGGTVDNSTIYYIVN